MTLIGRQFFGRSLLKLSLVQRVSCHRVSLCGTMYGGSRLSPFVCRGLELYRRTMPRTWAKDTLETLLQRSSCLDLQASPAQDNTDSLIIKALETVPGLDVSTVLKARQIERSIVLDYCPRSAEALGELNAIKGLRRGQRGVGPTLLESSSSLGEASKAEKAASFNPYPLFVLPAPPRLDYCALGMRGRDEA
jgi:hypothetical protein